MFPVSSYLYPDKITPTYLLQKDRLGQSIAGIQWKTTSYSLAWRRLVSCNCILSVVPKIGSIDDEVIFFNGVFQIRILPICQNLFLDTELSTLCETTGSLGPAVFSTRSTSTRTPWFGNILSGVLRLSALSFPLFLGETFIPISCEYGTKIRRTISLTSPIHINAVLCTIPCKLIRTTSVTSCLPLHPQSVLLNKRVLPSKWFLV